MVSVPNLRNPPIGFPASTSAGGSMTSFSSSESVSSSGTPTPCCVPLAGDTAWMLMATVLVLGMFPGLAFFELGLLRKKNTTSILAQVFCGLPVLSTLWITIGYTLSFGTDAGGYGLIGTLEYVFFATLKFDKCYHNAPIPEALYALFQMMFACITPLLMTGAYAERLAWKPFVLLTVLWEILVYYPVAHWMWAVDGWLALWGAQDFAGGIVIHTTAGAGALVVCIMLGRRHNFEKYHGAFPYSSLPMAGVGASLLWTGWFGFNGGSALGANHSAVSAVVNSQVAAATCACVFLSITYYRTGKPSTIAMLNGAIAGLAGVTPASGYISPLSAFVLGIVLAISAALGEHCIKHKLHIDDALDVSAVHGLTGIVGSLAIGIAGDASIGGADGVIASGGKSWDLFGKQVVAVVVCGAWAALGTVIILTVIKKFTPLRVHHHHELKGLDAAIHFETASNATSVAHPHEHAALERTTTLSVLGADSFKGLKKRQHSVGDASSLFGMPPGAMALNSSVGGVNSAIGEEVFSDGSSTESDDEVVPSDIRPSESSNFPIASSFVAKRSTRARGRRPHTPVLEGGQSPPNFSNTPMNGSLASSQVDQQRQGSFSYSNTASPTPQQLNDDEREREGLLGDDGPRRVVRVFSPGKEPNKGKGAGGGSSTPDASSSPMRSTLTPPPAAVQPSVSLNNDEVDT